MSINYKALILETENVESKNEEIKAKQAAAKKKPTVVYTIEGISGPDMVVNKKSAKKEEQFVMLVSQSQMYIKDMKTGTVALADPESINLFFDKLEAPLDCVDAEGHTLNWTSKFYRGMKFARVLDKLLGYTSLKDYFNKGMLYFNDMSEWQEGDLRNCSDSFQYKTISMIYQLLPEKYKKPYLNYVSSEMVGPYHYGRNRHIGLDDYDNTKMTSLVQEFKGEIENNILYKTYGLDGVRRIVGEYFQTAVSKFPRMYGLGKLFDGESDYNHRAPRYVTTFEITPFIQYLFYSSVEQGYANEIDNFIDMWRDTLSMQAAIFKHGIVDKYPETLATSHQILCYKYELLKQKIDEESWATQVAEMKKYERHGEKYIIIAPQTPDDMINEARMQSNCLSSYVRHVINGDCMIFFMRLAKEPDKSLVTIEICADGSLGQVKAKYNHNPSTEEKNYVDKWYKDKFINGKLNDEEEE